jgi:hypothetical protein
MLINGLKKLNNVLQSANSLVYPWLVISADQHINLWGILPTILHTQILSFQYC